MNRLAIIGLLSLLISCAQSRFVEPLNKGELSVGGNFGGPLIAFGGTPIPVPLSSLEVGFGLDSNLTIHGGWHTTAAFFGNFQMDAGVTYRFLKQKKFVPNLSGLAGFNFVGSFDSKETRFWPVLDLNAYWNYGKRRNYWYVGFNNYFEPRGMMAHEQQQNHHWVFSPQLGHVVKGKKIPWRFTAEVKFIAPYLQNPPSFIPYQSIFGKWGATGIYLGFSYPIQLKK